MRAVRRPRRSLVVLAGRHPVGDSGARALTETLDKLGVQARYLGAEQSAAEIAAAAVAEGADAVELCLTPESGVVLVRTLLRELTALGRADVSIVVHRIP